MNRIEDYRPLFPSASDEISHFAHCTWSPVSKPGVQACEKILNLQYSPHSSNYRDLAARAKTTGREEIAQLIGSRADEIAFVENTSMGINTVAHGLDWQAGDNVIVGDIEFAANVYPWLQLKRNGVEVRFVKAREGRLLIEDMQAAMNSKTRLIAVSHVQYLSGFRINLENLSQICKAKNILLMVDAIQSAGSMKIDVSKYKIDFLTAGSYKWLFGPAGTGFLYCHQNNKDLLKNSYTGHNSMVTYSVKFPYEENLRDNAERFEIGTTNVLGLVGMTASVQILNQIGSKAIEDRIFDINEEIHSLLEKKNYQIASPRKSNDEKSGIIAFYPKTGSPVELASRCFRAGVVLAPRSEIIRTAPHFYINQRDIQKLAEVLP